jgi:hypothetical protein
MSEDTIRKDLKKLLKEHFLSPIGDQIKNEIVNFERIVAHIQSFQSSKKKTTSNKEIASYSAQLHSIVDEIWEAPEQKGFAEVYGSLTDELNQVFEGLDEIQVKEQSRNRFYALEDDSRFLRLKKWTKRIGYSVSRIFKKKYKTQFWNHSIPLRSLAHYHFHSQLVLDLRDVTGMFYKTFSVQYVRLKEAEESLSDEGIDVSDKLLKEIKSELTNLMKLIEQCVDENLETRYASFIADLDIVDTLELSTGRFTPEAVDRSIKRSEVKWGDNRKKWSNTLYSLFEEWRSDLDIFHLKYQTLSQLDSFKTAQIKKLGSQIEPEIASILTFLSETNSELGKKEADPKKKLKAVGLETQKRLGKELVPKLCEKLTSQNITNLINKLEASIHKSVEELSEEHVRVKTSSYDQPMDDDELKKISLHELISFETLVTFQEDFEVIKKGLFKALEDATTYTSDLPQIISFSISASIAAFEEGKSDKEALSIATDGFARASTRMITTHEQLNIAIAENSEQLNTVVNAFCDAIIELTYSENVGELRLRIAKAKAAKQAEEVKIKLVEKIKSRKAMILELGKNVFHKVELLMDRFSKKFILTAGMPVLSREVSDFLLESQYAIDSLPLIYRRLYRIEPLEDLELFEGREAELKQLNDAYESWKRGRFAATAILGEKWGGLTTFINYANWKSDYSHPLTRFSANENISTSEDLIGLLNQIFEESFEDINDAIDYLNSGFKRIIILEDLQNMYLRKVGGFAALQLLFQLISSTSKNVFWVTTTTIYTWQYLVKAIGIGDFFSYSIELGELTKDQIVNIIWKRNRISGYSILFEPSESLLNDKKFIKMSSIDQQSFLKDEYFSELNSFARSNVSLALIFWLLSTKKVDQSEITIGSFKKPDLDFLNVMAMEKIYTVHALIMHDGLSELHLSEVLNISIEKSKLNLLALLEDGIIMKSESKYLVNPIVYRNAISVLKAKNLIH